MELVTILPNSTKLKKLVASTKRGGKGPVKELIEAVDFIFDMGGFESLLEIRVGFTRINRRAVDGLADGRKLRKKKGCKFIVYSC